MKIKIRNKPIIKNKFYVYILYLLLFPILKNYYYIRLIIKIIIILYNLLCYRIKK